MQETATGKIYYGSTADNEFRTAWSEVLNGGGGNPSRLIFQTTLHTLGGTALSEVVCKYTWMDDSHWCFKIKTDSTTIPLGYTVFAANNGDVYAYFSGAPHTSPVWTFTTDNRSGVWGDYNSSGSEGITATNASGGFCKIAISNVSTGSQARTAIIAKSQTGYGTGVFYSNEYAEPYAYNSGYKTASIGDAELADGKFTLLGPICSNKSTHIATSAKFLYMGSQTFSPGDYSIGNHAFRYISNGIFLDGVNADSSSE